MERAKENLRIVKSQISGKRRPSLLDEIQVAKEVILKSERMPTDDEEDDDVDEEQEYRGIWRVSRQELDTKAT
ncbi:hypothetical protein P5673_003609 [Acropora cervicornis]|uniref:Uncharacterized protein n=1 Tax=Acropora cervicornis TaxID=6130 RepID=A0AAD9R0W3_ACRCE|nr:hypothetical protein P5673_003609 [Acropora cervicornis]